MASVKEILDVLFRLAPEALKEDWDNVGLLCGHEAARVDTVLVALDPTMTAAMEAKEVGAQLLLTHHPVIFGSLRSVSDASLTGRILLYLIENGIAAANLHTNLDKASPGVNSVLADALGLAEPVCIPSGSPEPGFLRMGDVPEQPVEAFAAFVKSALHCPGVRYASGGRPVRRVAVGGGSCGSEIPLALAAGCDTLVTADLKYNHFLDARDLGINLVDAGHFETEDPVCTLLAQTLREEFPQLRVLLSKKHADPTQFI